MTTMIFIGSPSNKLAYGGLSRIRESLVKSARRIIITGPGLTGFVDRYLVTVAMRIQNGALGHIVLNVADLKKSERFYTAVLGLKVSARNLQTKMTFLSYGREHHDIALQALPKDAKHVSGKGMAKLHHFCIYVEKNQIIDEIFPILKRRKIPIVSGPETLVVAGNRSISFLDPDGNRVEIACNANKFKFDNRKR